MAELMRKKSGDDEGQKGAPGWMVTFADLMTLLLTFFIMLVAMSTMQEERIKVALGSLRGALGVLEGGGKTVKGRAELVALRDLHADVKATPTNINRAVDEQLAKYSSDQHIQIAMRDAVLNYCRTAMSKQVPNDSANPRAGNEIVGSSPGGLYPCKPGGADDHCFIFASRANEEHWRRLARIIGRVDMIDYPNLQNPNDRYAARETVDAAITGWTMQHSKDEVMQAIAGAGVPCGAVFNTLELMHDEDLHARGIMTKIDHPQRGAVNVAAWPLKMSDSHVPVKSSPLLGADNEAIYGDWLGYSEDDVRDMRERRVI